jgi:protein-S-isoprenylcysteine O-methyltransferase Ste14
MTEPASTDRPNQYPWPPIIYAVALGAALILDQIVPWWPSHGFAGAVLMAAGLSVAIAGFMHFQSIGTTFDPTGPAAKLATGGIYVYTRNPMYVGALVFFVGFAVLMQSGWLLAAVPAVGLALKVLAIEPEEAYLTRRFGDDYRAYCAKVRRWV